MEFKCHLCGETKDFFTDWKMTVVQSGKNAKTFRYCKSCRSGTIEAPDVYWDGKEEHGLADDPVTGKPRVFLSRGQKAAYLKERGLSEAGDRYHGAPATMETTKKDSRQSRELVRSALREVKTYGREYRRAKMNEINYMRRKYAKTN